MARRVCIVTPGALGSNPRAVKEADALSGAGCDVTVISTRTLDAVDALDADVLARAAWRSVRLDLRDRRRRAGERMAQLAAAAAFRAVGAASLAERGLSVFAGPLTWRTRLTPADLYIGHYPAGLAAAGRAARAHGAPFAFDAEDFHLGETFGAAQRMTRAVEARWLPGCAWVTAASPGIAEAYVRSYAIAQPTVLLNVFPLAEAPPRPTCAGAASPGPSVYWFSQTIGPDRGLECAVRAIGLAGSRPHLYLRGVLAAGFGETLARLAAEADVADRLHLLPAAPPGEMTQLASAYDLGLAAETGGTENHRVALSNKQFTYLLAGVPAVMSDVPAHQAFAAEAEGAAFLYRTEDPSSLAEALDRLLLRPERLEAARRRAFQLAQTRYNWDHEQAGLLRLAATVLGGPLR